MAEILLREGSSFRPYCPFPVGTCLFCLYDPNTVWPGTTWHKHGEGHYLVSAGDTYKANNTYGSNTHTLTIDEMPSHNHSGTTDEIKYGTNWNPGNDWSYSVASSATFSQYRSLIINSTGGASSQQYAALLRSLYLEKNRVETWLEVLYNAFDN